jgi:hypothetical protein
MKAFLKIRTEIYAPSLGSLFSHVIGGPYKKRSQTFGCFASTKVKYAYNGKYSNLNRSVKGICATAADRSTCHILTLHRAS